MSFGFGFLTITQLLRKCSMSGTNAHKLPEVVRRHYIKDMTQKRENHSNAFEAKELRFALPYGHLAAKEWGNPNGLPVLAVHGWYDFNIEFHLISAKLNDR